MNDITIKPTNVTLIARYLLSLQQSAVEISYQTYWLSSMQRLKEVLDAYLNPGQITGETMIDHFDRSLSHLFESTRLLTQQINDTSKQQLHTYLQTTE